MENTCCIVFALAAFTMVTAWPDLYDNEFKRWALARRSFDCKSSGRKCYSTSDCCDDYVCAAFDDFGLRPTMPGLCVHEKELEPCVDDMDCDSGTKCKALDGHRYCVPSQSEPAKSKQHFGFRKGTRGSNCEDQRDCAPYDSDSKTKLCCQKIRMGRSGIKRKCDPITPISVCVASRKR